MWEWVKRDELGGCHISAVRRGDAVAGQVDRGGNRDGWTGEEICWGRELDPVTQGRGECSGGLLSFQTALEGRR